MTDPTRLLSRQSDADPLERSLLESLQRSGPGEAVKGAIWQDLAASALVAGVVIAAAPAAASGAAAALGTSVSGGAGSTLVTGTVGTANAVAGLAGAKGSLGGFAGTLSALVPKALATKLVLAGAIAATSAGGYAAWKTQHVLPARQATVQERRAAPRVAHAPLQRAEPAAERVTPAEAMPEESAPVAPAEATRNAHHHRHHEQRAQVQSERLLLESKLLAEARGTLRAGDLTRTGLLLRKLQSEFPRGGLMQEREVLQVELAFAHGDTIGAQKRAQAFLARHPESPHNLTLRRFVSPP